MYILKNDKDYELIFIIFPKMLIDLFKTKNFKSPNNSRKIILAKCTKNFPFGDYKYNNYA